MKTALFVVLVSLGLAGSASADRFEILSGEKENQVKFESHAPLESFDGKTNKVWGEITCDPADLTDPVFIRIAVDLASLDTGIKLRNKHMRDNHLETKKYPHAVFTGETLGHPSAPALSVGEEVTFKVTGSMELHGVTRELIADVEAMLEPGGDLKITSRFDIVLSDYEIKRPRFLMLKLDETQKVTFQVKARVASENGKS